MERDPFVWVKREVEREMTPEWLGPYKVKEVLPNGSAYILENL